MQAKPTSTSHPASWPTARGLHHLPPSGNGQQLLVSLGLWFYTDLCCDSFTRSRNTTGNESSLRTDRPSCQAGNGTPHNHHGGRELPITHHSRGRYGTAGACQRPPSLAGLDTAAEAVAPAALLGTAIQLPEHTAAGRGQVKGQLRAPHREAGMEPGHLELRSWCLHPPSRCPSRYEGAHSDLSWRWPGLASDGPFKTAEKMGQLLGPRGLITKWGHSEVPVLTARERARDSRLSALIR